MLLNYQGRPRDVMTLAHELGHGVHQVLAAPNGALMAPTPLTLAETASVFGEMLTFRKLLAQTTDKKQRKAMLAAKVEDMINTVVRLEMSCKVICAHHGVDHVFHLGGEQALRCFLLGGLRQQLAEGEHLAEHARGLGERQRRRRHQRAMGAAST